MGKSAPTPSLPPPPPPPPTTPVRAVGDSGDRTPTEVLAEREEAREAVVTSSDTESTPKPQRERIMPASVIDTETAGRKTEREVAARKGRKATRKTGPQGLLSPAPVAKRGLMGS